jgi:hypothetical protein
MARGLGPTRHASQLRAEEDKPPCAVRTTAQRLQATLHFCPDQRAKGRAAVQAACNRAKWAHFSDSQHAQHGGPGPRVMQPVRRLLRVSNCIATCATTAPRDGNGYPKPEYPTGFTRYKGRYGMISLPAGMLMGKTLYPLGRRVRVWVGTTHTRLPVGKIYPHQ